MLGLVRGFAFTNPHLSISYSNSGADCSHHWEAFDLQWEKWRPCDPAPAQWYSVERFERLIAANITHDRAAGRVRMVREFISEFRGLSSTAKHREILGNLDLSRASLDDLIRADGALDKNMLSRLLQAMQENSRAPKPATLGVLGKEFLHYRLVDDFNIAPDTFEYSKSICETDGGVPYVAESSFGYVQNEDARALITGVNWSPGINDPFRQLRCATSLQSLLSSRFCSTSDPVIVTAHLACARVGFTDRGKSAVAMEEGQSKAFVTIVEDVTESWKKQREREIKDARAAARRGQALSKVPKTSIKTASHAVMADAYMHASSNNTLPAAARQIMYAARARILQRFDGIDLGNKFDRYFTQTVLPDFMTEFPEQTADWDVVYDARGGFTEPHTGRRVPLGTVDVRRYITGRAPLTDVHDDSRTGADFVTHGPENRFSAVLFVEKEGFLPLFTRVKLAERFDIGIMSTKGMSVVAARQLAEWLGKLGVRVLIIRDFDKAGFSIAGTLRNDTRRWTFTGSTDHIIDLGLRLEDVGTYDLQGEPVTYSAKRTSQWGDDEPVVLKRTEDIRAHIETNLRKNGATENEIEYLCHHRVELNAFSSAQLIDWIERRLTEAGVQKVVPDACTISPYALQVAKAWKVNKLLEQQNDELVDWVESLELPGDFQVRLGQLLASRRTLSWDEGVSELVEEWLAEGELS